MPSPLKHVRKHIGRGLVISPRTDIAHEEETPTRNYST